MTDILNSGPKQGMDGRKASLSKATERKLTTITWYTVTASSSGMLKPHEFQKLMSKETTELFSSSGALVREAEATN